MRIIILMIALVISSCATSTYERVLNVADINAVHISLKAADKLVLFILIASDGTINRMGTGAVNNTRNNLYIGVAREDLLSQLLSNMDDGMLDNLSSYDAHDKSGVPLELYIGLVFADGTENGFGFHYGSESIGPPQEIKQLVTAAVKLTDPWY